MAATRVKILRFSLSMRAAAGIMRPTRPRELGEFGGAGPDIMSATHFHLMLNHFPVLGTGFGLLLLVLGLARKSEELKRAALLLFILAAVVALPVYLTGDPSQKAVQGLPGISGAVTQKHEEVAGLALSAALVLGGWSMSAFLLFRKGTPLPKWFVLVVLAAVLVTGGLLAWAANLGGQVRHTEIRPVPALEK